MGNDVLSDVKAMEVARFISTSACLCSSCVKRGTRYLSRHGPLLIKSCFRTAGDSSAIRAGSFLHYLTAYYTSKHKCPAYITYTSCSSIRCLFILLVEPSARGIHAIAPSFSQTEHRAHLSWRGDNLKWFHSHVLVNFGPVGCTADFTALSGGLSSKVLAFLERCVSSSASVASFPSDDICHAKINAREA